MRWLKMTVLPLPVASERPRRREPLARFVRTEVMDSSWYGRSWIVGVPSWFDDFDEHSLSN
jgi:hypothetical protein